MDFSTTTWILIIGIPLLVGIGVFLFLRNRQPREQELLYFRCPGCKRRLRYFPRQVGHKGMCSNCKEPFVFPTATPVNR
ncbi:MAG TPA: LPXTG cell wall anchor domain-containing protein [Gemmataceae bacterium]|nr:LPXTG cell wall anchor domain-containing protein [Gemmataceae bacterium]